MITASNIDYNPSMLPKRRNRRETRMKLIKSAPKISISFCMRPIIILMVMGTTLFNLHCHQFYFNRSIVDPETSYQLRSSALSRVRESAVETELTDCFTARQGITPKSISTPYINLGFPKTGKEALKQSH